MKKTVNYNTLLDELEAELTKSIQDASSLSLAKSEEDKKPEDHKDEHKDEHQEDRKDDQKEHGEEHKEHQDGHGYSDEDLEEMHKMYSSMSPAEHKVHHESLQRAMGITGESTEEEDKDKKHEDKKDDEKDIEKCGESMKMSEKNPSEDLLKSEVELLKKELEAQKKNFDGVLAAMTTFVSKKSAPARKAITEIEYVKKSETPKESEKNLTKSEITAILNKKAQDGSLSKSDREAINAFYMNGASLEKVKHLLT